MKTTFDNTTIGKPWYNDNELSQANNIERVIFNVESVDISIGKPDILACHDDQSLACVLPIDSALTHSGTSRPPTVCLPAITCFTWKSRHG